MQGGGANAQERTNPPAPESPIWLPSLASARTAGQLSPGSSLPRARDVPLAGTLKSSPADLYRVDNLTAQSLPLPALSPQHGNKASHVPKLPCIDSGLRRSGGSPVAGRSPKQPREATQSLQQQQPQSATKRAKPAHVAEEAAAAAAAYCVDEQHCISRAGASSSSLSQYQQHADHQQPVSDGEGEYINWEADDAAMDSDADDEAAAGPRVPEPTYDPDAVPGVTTGEDVVAYYGKYGQDSTVKFFYCVRPPEGMRFRPYDLIVVPRERLALYSEYFTVSANGVMMVRRGVQAEFVPLASWVRQASLFDLVSNIGFFKNYVTGRAFRRWHKGVRQKNFKRVRSVVQRQLFGARPTFSGVLREVQAAVAELDGVHLAWANPNHMYSLQVIGAQCSSLQTQPRQQPPRSNAGGSSVVSGTTSCVL
eukprot:GHRQ01024001.1.p1 GENE.GHRQ01024001.1~~GHRQ01024001.1.p1  ORF type:complete len:423 (+),score=129.38 GHRQ01024001.1:383-1651(+)